MGRYIAYLLSLIAAAASAIAVSTQSAWAWGIVIALPLAALGTWDLLQPQHTLLRNYPIVGRLRWLLEAIRPQVQQYFINDDLAGRSTESSGHSSMRGRRDKTTSSHLAQRSTSTASVSSGSIIPFSLRTSERRHA